jgi:hypothetical protein
MQYINLLIDFILDNIYIISFIGGLIVLVKIFLVGFNKGFDPADIIISFFKFYNKYDFEMSSKVYRKRYMVLNNNLNVIIYIWAAIVTMVWYSI